MRLQLAEVSAARQVQLTATEHAVEFLEEMATMCEESFKYRGYCNAARRTKRSFGRDC